MRLLFYNICFAIGVTVFAGKSIGRQRVKLKENIEIKTESSNISVSANYVIPKARIQLLYPRGFCIAVPGCSSIRRVELDIEVITSYHAGLKKLDVRFFRRTLEKRDVYGSFSACFRRCPWKLMDRIRYNMKQVLVVNGKQETHEAIFMVKISTDYEDHTVLKEVYSYTPALTEAEYLGMKHHLQLNQYKTFYEKRLDALKGSNATGNVTLPEDYYHYEYNVKDSEEAATNEGSTKPTRPSAPPKPYKSTAHPYLAREIYRKVYKDRIGILSTLPYSHLMILKDEDLRF